VPRFFLKQPVLFSEPKLQEEFKALLIECRTQNNRRKGLFWAPELDPKGLTLRHKSLTFFHKSVSLCQKSRISYQKRIVFYQKSPIFQSDFLLAYLCHRRGGPISAQGASRRLDKLLFKGTERTHGRVD